LVCVGGRVMESAVALLSLFSVVAPMPALAATTPGPRSLSAG
jgi:hypothetical protein